MADTIDGSYYLVVYKKNYSNLGARLSNKSPALKSGELAIKVLVSIPRAMFERPQLQAQISIPETSVTPKVLDAIVLDNVQEVLKATLGFDIKLSVVDPE